MRTKFLIPILMLLLSNGILAQNIGVNTDTPVFKMDVRSTDDTLDSPDLQLATLNEQHFLRLFGGRAGDARPFILFSQNDTLRIATATSEWENFTERVTFLPDGKTGFGVMLPKEKIHLHNPDLTPLPPPFQGFIATPEYIQITNGVTGDLAESGLRVGVNEGGQAVVTSDNFLRLNANNSVLVESNGLTINAGNNNYLNMIPGATTLLDSNLILSGNLQLTSLSGAGMRNVQIDGNGNLGVGPADNDWQESGSFVYNVSEKIGIGTSTPSANFEVHGLDNDGSNAAVRFVSTSNLVTHEMLLDGNEIDVTASGGTVLSDDLSLQGNGIGGVNMVRGGGSVAIGTVVEDRYRLTITGQRIDEQEQDLAFSPAVLNLVDQDENGVNQLIFDGNEIQSVDGELMINSRGQNVGVGAFPNSKLTVRGDESSGLKGTLELRNFGNSDALVFDGNEIDFSGTSSALFINSNSLEPISIGTQNTAAGYLLNVGGKIMAEEVRVQLMTNWPDYVFSDDYELKDLDHLKNSIESEGHLPGIPAAKIIERDGLEIGEMQRLTIEKVEELTLYVIQLHERVKSLEGENAELRERIETLQNAQK